MKSIRLYVIVTAVFILLLVQTASGPCATPAPDATSAPSATIPLTEVISPAPTPTATKASTPPPSPTPALTPTTKESADWNIFQDSRYVFRF